MQSLERKSLRPRPKSFETETKPETFETETSKYGSLDASRDLDQVSRLHHRKSYKKINKMNVYIAHNSLYNPLQIYHSRDAKNR